jgi:hypothetical protein
MLMLFLVLIEAFICLFVFYHQDGRYLCHPLSPIIVRLTGEKIPTAQSCNMAARDQAPGDRRVYRAGSVK